MSATPSSETASPTTSQRASALFAAAMIHVICGVIALMGLTVLASGLSSLLKGQGAATGTLLAIGVGALFAAIGLGFFYLTYVAAPAHAAREEAQAARHAGEPWMLREDWVARRVVDSSSLAVMIFLWIWTAGWGGISAFLWTVNGDKITAALHESWLDTALTALIPLVGLIGLIGAVKATRFWWRYGSSTLHIDTLPGFLGDRFRGSVAARLAIPPTRPLEARIACERLTWMRVRDSDGHWTKEWRTTTVWSETHEIETARLMRTKDGVAIPIDIPLPVDQPACALDEDGAGIQWSLSLRATDRARPRFAAQFLVPVYRRK
jgi:hypothetical protein